MKMNRGTLVLALVAGFYSLTLGCVSSHYDGDAAGYTIEGYAPSSGTVSVQFWNFVTNAWVTTHTTTATTNNLWYQSNDLFRWTWDVPSIIPSAYKSAGRIRLRFLQGTTPFYVYDPSLNTAVPGANSPGQCVIANLANYVENTDWSEPTSNVLRVENYRIFTTCGGSAQTAIDLDL